MDELSVIITNTLLAVGRPPFSTPNNSFPAFSIASPVTAPAPPDGFVFSTSIFISSASYVLSSRKMTTGLSLYSRIETWVPGSDIS